MTTKVKIEIVQNHMPVVVETLRIDGSIAHTQRLRDAGEAAEEYVHSGQVLRVREMTTEEMAAEPVLGPYSSMPMRVAARCKTSCSLLAALNSKDMLLHTP